LGPAPKDIGKARMDIRPLRAGNQIYETDAL
jgi:hypothetical protein